MRRAAFLFLVLIAATTAGAQEPPVCCGDCNGDRVVKASEIGRAERIKDGSHTIDFCRAADCLTQDGKVDGAEVELAKVNSLTGCGK